MKGSTHGPLGDILIQTIAMMSGGDADCNRDSNVAFIRAVRKPLKMFVRAVCPCTSLFNKRAV